MRYDGADVTAARTIQFMTRERTNPNGIRTSLRLARENARVVRDRISNEMWEAINEMWLNIDRMMERSRRRALPEPVRRGAQRRGALPRHLRQHDDARRGVRLLSPRHLRRARRHDGAHPRREVPPAAARRGDGRVAARLLPVGGAAEIAVGVRGVPPPLPRRPAAGGHRRVRALRTRLPALAAFLGGSHGPRAARARRQGADDRAAAKLRELDAHLAEATAEQVFTIGLHEYLDQFLAKVGAFNGAVSRAYFEQYLGDDR